MRGGHLYKNFSFNANFFVYDDKWGRLNNIKNMKFSEAEQKQLVETAEAARTITAWRVKKGNAIK